MIKVCFVCLGNIVRSPVAEAIFFQLAAQDGITERFYADSAGVGNWHLGEPPDSRMRRVAARHGLIYDHRAHQIQRQDFDIFDLILALDLDNRDDLLTLARSPEHRSKIRLLREMDSQGGPNASVPDPYYGGIDGFEEVYTIIHRSVTGWFAALQNGGWGSRTDG